MTMKTTHRARHKKQAWSESNRENYRKLKWRNSSEELGTECCEINIKRISRPNTSNPSVLNLRPAKAIGFFRPVGKWTNYTAEFITRSSPLMIPTAQKLIPRRSSAVALTQSILLPPIKGSRMTPGEIVCASTHASHLRISPSHPVKLEESKAKLKARLSTSNNLNKENKLFRLYVTRRNESKIPESDFIHGSLTVRKLQDCLKKTPPTDASVRPVSANEEFNATPVASSSAPLNLLTKRQKPDKGNRSANASRAMTNGTGGDIARLKPKQTQELSSNGSPIETESQCTENKDDSEVIPGKLYSPEEEYYTYQRIAEWVLKVNACMFSPSRDSMRRITPSQEQDTAIKIVYEGD